MAKIIILVGPPGSGKSTLSKQYTDQGFTRISTDDQGKVRCMEIFQEALSQKKDIVVDRMGFDREQRGRYLKPAHEAGYQSEIIILHQPREVCLQRAKDRKGHPTVKCELDAEKAVGFFFKNYSRVTDDEAHVVTRKFPEGDKPKAVICDLDGTLCDIRHRRHFVQGEGKKNWAAFFKGIPDDKVNQWCADILQGLYLQDYRIVYCSGRGEEDRQMTEDWLKAKKLDIFQGEYIDRPPAQKAELFMRPAQDSRKDSIVKEILLDFEILTRYTPVFILDDRKQVVDMWRSRGLTCLQCDPGEF